MRYPAAVWFAGPADKAGYPGIAVNECRGVICHSMVGSASAALARLVSDDRASWAFSVLQDGTVLQHYESNAVCWHAGSAVWNGRLIGIEHEGGALGNVSERLTDAQRAASVALVRWLGQAHGFRLIRDGLAKTLYEHNETGYPTACPSGRIPWPAYTEDDEMWFRLNGTAAFFNNKALGQTVPNVDGVMQLAVDFPNLPADARAVDLEVRLATPVGAGALIMKDGDGAYAGQFNANRPEGIVRVVPAGDHSIRFQVLGSVRTLVVGVVGYVR